MAALMVNSKLSFNELKELLELTDGNLASHLKALEKLAYVTVNKAFIGRKPNTTYTVTSAGRQAFERHLQALGEFIKQQNISNKNNNK